MDNKLLPEKPKKEFIKKEKDLFVAVKAKLDEYITFLSGEIKTGLKEGTLVGFLGDTHIYENHIEGLKEQLTRKPYPLPKLITENWKSIFDWKYEDSKVENYEHHKRIKFDVAV